MQINNREVPKLFNSKEECCGCGACVNICPRNAITMSEDECGYIYPIIDELKCVRCGKCKTVCAFQNEKVTNNPLKTYAAVASDSELVRKSASGGFFTALSKQIVEEDGVVFGAAFCDEWNVQHISVEDEKQLERLQGSKYTQSNTCDSYSKVKDLLMQGKKVLYSGTPCQIAGLYGYLGNKPENLLTVDIICHGVPSNRMFKDYLNSLEKRENGELVDFTFRDKTIGWGINGSAKIERNSKIYRKKIWQSGSSYLFYFIKGWIYRENCYQCKYASANRPADLTIGDFWGIEKQHADYIGKRGWDEQKGISVVVANTDKGMTILKSLKYIELKESSFDAASEGNAQLRKPCQPGKREEIVHEYVKNGWDGLEERYNKNIGWRKYSSQLKNMIPTSIKRVLKKMK